MASSATGKNDIAQAWLTRPTKRYDHAILGDAIEAGGLAVKTRDGKTLELSCRRSSCSKTAWLVSTTSMVMAVTR
jgi:hypothetical protein